MVELEFAVFVEMVGLTTAFVVFLWERRLWLTQVIARYAHQGLIGLLRTISQAL